MTNEEKILELLTKMQGDITEIRNDIDIIKEVQAEHTIALNAIIEWADECREIDKLPLPKLM